MAVLRTSSEKVTLVLTVHHALLDGRSLTLLWQEWLAGYEALLQGRDPPPAAPSGQRADKENQAGA